MTKKRSKKPARKSRPPAKRKATTAQALDPRAQLLATSTTGTLPAVSEPGGPSAVAGRPPVPAMPTFAEHMIGAAIFGRPTAALTQYRDPPVAEGGKEADMCAGCDVDCCTGHVIPLNAYDVWRIKSTLNIPVREFVGLGNWDKSVPSHGVRIGAERFTMILKRRMDRSCAFLLRVGPQRRCGIHGVRPDACRIFPFIPDLEMQKKQEGDAMVQMHPAHCPWRWPATQEHKARVLQDIQDNTAHRKVDRDILSRWFWAVGVEKTVENFYSFLEAELPRYFLRPDEHSPYLTTLW